MTSIQKLSEGLGSLRYNVGRITSTLKTYQNLKGSLRKNGSTASSEYWQTFFGNPCFEIYRDIQWEVSWFSNSETMVGSWTICRTSVKIRKIKKI